MIYRNEIDGLRAIAVVAVIFFHAQFELCKGGFVGVDIFFVISGYLITTIIIRDLEKRQFCLVDFYYRRARRIIPALSLIVIACIPLAWVCLTPADFRLFSKSLLGVASFSSNIVFWWQGGYFDTNIESTPLMHTWSLAVEEHYYILFPIVLMTLWSYGSRIVLFSLSLSFCGSLALAQLIVIDYPSTAFFLLPTRTWELLLGSFCAFYLQYYPNTLQQRPSTWVNSDHTLITPTPFMLLQLGSLTGLMLIAFSIYTFSEHTPTPSIFTVLPTFGSALILVCSSEQTLVYKLLSYRPLRLIGLLSYSLYLWHQPLFSFAQHFFFYKLSFLFRCILILISFGLAYLSWRWVEAPFRKKPYPKKKTVFRLSAIVLVIFFLCGFIGYINHGFLYRFKGKEKEILSSGQQEVLHEQTETYNSTARVSLIGDSHADSFHGILRDELAKINISLNVHKMYGCAPVYGLIRHDSNQKNRCHKHFKKIYQKILNENATRLVLISARYTLYLESKLFDNQEGGVEEGRSDAVLFDSMAFSDRIRTSEERKTAVLKALSEGFLTLANRGKNVLIIGPIPEVGWNTPVAALFNYRRSISAELTTSEARFYQRNRTALNMLTDLQRHPNIMLALPHRVLCENSRCNATNNHIPLYYDSNHLNRRGAELVVEGLDLVNKIANLLSAQENSTIDSVNINTCRRSET